MARDILLRTAAALTLCFGFAASALPQDEPGPSQAEKPESAAERSVPEAGTSERQIRELLQRLEKVETELSRLKASKGQLPADKKDQKLLALLETPHLGHHYYNNPGRFFAARIIFINLTPQPVVLKKDQFSLDINGTPNPLKDVPAQLQYMSFQAGSETVQLRNLQTPAELRINSGGTASTWVVFTEIGAGNDVPELVLKIGAGEQKIELDVNQFALGQLGLEIERIGPRESLGLVTINGSLNSINAGSLTDAFQTLAEQHKIARGVIRWGAAAPAIDQQALGWLVQSAQAAGRGQNQNQQFPSFPGSLRELHLAKIPNSNVDVSNYSQQGTAARVHKTEAEAAAAALQSAYEVLPIDELVTEIERGHSLVRAAALSAGGGRLPSEKLPLLLKYADDSSPEMQRGALVALRHFGEPEAVAKLEQYALKNVEPLGSTALESLAASRFPAANEVLLKVLKNEPAATRKRIVSVIARYPRPAWSEAVYELVKDPNSGLGADGLTALNLVGHPKLVEVLESALAGRDAGLRNAAFGLLAERMDAESEELALKYTLEHLKTGVPTPQMTSLLSRTKDPRAVPLLVAQFEKQPAARAALIGTLAAVGDQTVADLFVREYPKLGNNEKAQVLNALMQLKSPHSRKLAGEAVLSSDASLASTGSNLLQQDGGPEAVKLLAEALEKSPHNNTWSYVTNALANTGGPEARAALLKARSSGDQNKQNMANNALRNLWQRSPGYQYIYQGQQLTRQEQWKGAIEQYTLAIDADPELPDAWAGRANAYLKQSKNKEARADYAKAAELDPWNGMTITGLGVLMAMEGEYEAAVKKIEEARPRVSNDSLFAYNSACVYCQAAAAVKKDEKADDKDAKADEYQKKALAELKRSVQMGFSDFDWMKKDPDLTPLHELEEFKEVSKPGAVRAGRRGRVIRP